MKRLLFLLLLLAFLHGCRREPGPRVLILGLDGCDPKLLQSYLDQGKLPNFERLKQMGGLHQLQTVVPPQSPVAWASFTTGLDPGGHGIFDFIQRDPATLQPVPSLTRVTNGRSQLLRKGAPFWEYLVNAGIPAVLMKVPANFPPDGLPGTVLTGMGTPDVEGTYGTFTYYTSETTNPPSDLTGGRWVRVEKRNNLTKMSLVGPSGESLPLQVAADKGAALLDAAGRKLVLKKGEWSEWIPLSFPSGGGMVRFYLKDTEPLKLYASPVNMDPCRPLQAITSPDSFSCHLCRCCGRFYTQGMPEDTKALMHEVLSDAEFLTQNQLVIEERRRLFRQGLSEFEEGLFFFYFSAPDILSHLYWNTIDPNHPGYDAERAELYSSAIESAYIEADALVGEALSRVDERTTLLVISDHGFAPFYRSVNLNGWLQQQGYLLSHGDSPADFDWSKTRAYGIGFNGLYLNLEGREAQGIVEESEKEELLRTLEAELLNLRDPKTGEKAIGKIYLSESIYSDANRSLGPDLVVGYNPGYRASWRTVLGDSQGEIFEDNRSVWSGDHLMAAEAVPGILLSSRPVRKQDCSLLDIAPTVLRLFDLDPPQAMRGG